LASVAGFGSGEAGVAAGEAATSGAAGACWGAQAARNLPIMIAPMPSAVARRKSRRDKSDIDSNKNYKNDIRQSQKHYRCYASNSAGSSWASATATFTTTSGSSPTAPAVTNSTGATAVTSSSARLNGEITGAGGENPTVKIYWGAADGGTATDNWTHNINLGIKTQGAFFTDITGLSDNTTYYYRCYASNSAGSSWAGSTASFTAGSGGVTFVYDGDGNRVKKTEGGQTILYINRYYEKNLTTGEVTTYYYFGGRLSAVRKGASLQYVHQDHLTGTAVMTDSTGAQVGTTMKYYPFGATRSGSVPTDIKFTGQRLDGTGLYYFNARYYDPNIGRFISADTVVPGVFSSQAYNRYSYCVNNPLKYVDLSGHWPGDGLVWGEIHDAITHALTEGLWITGGSFAGRDRSHSDGYYLGINPDYSGMSEGWSGRVKTAMNSWMGTSTGSNAPIGGGSDIPGDSDIPDKCARP